ncbi:PREDICTED: cathelicidin-B1-like [Aptenodytes forsteri]|uniref:cathelicidin-B1-like n=1 Tax=Aptenodytes forsteri TaxID=9233 RepID=UPI0004F43DE5|nr:PREDICTED: cathelicidin-B1-like [Aptenodytes forsteri]
MTALPAPTTPGPDGSTLGLTESVPPSPTGLWAVSYEDAVSAAVERLNARAVSPYVLRLREAQPRPGWPGDLQHPQELSFIVEETRCRAPGMATAACRSRWLGVVIWCQGSVFLEQQQPTVELSCEKLGRTQTSRLMRLFARLREHFGGFFQCGKIWIRDKLNLKYPKA